MKKSGFTKQERAFITLMRFWAVVFLFAGILFAVAPGYIPNYVANIGTIFLGWQASPPDLGTGRFWVVLAVALLFALSYMCVIVQRNIVRNIGYTRPIILAKLVSSVGFAICFIAGERQFLYLVSAIVDGAISFLTWRFYRMAMRSRG